MCQATKTTPLPWRYDEREYVRTHRDINKGYGINISCIDNFDAWKPGTEAGLYFEKESGNRTYLGPGATLANFYELHGSRPLRDATRYSLSQYKNVHTQVI